MSAKPRDLFKTRRQRLGEVYMALHEGFGAFDTQVVSFGGNLAVGSTTTALAFDSTEYILGQAVKNLAANVVGVAVPASITNAVGQWRKVLVQVDATGTITFKSGNPAATSIADAVKPAPDVNKIELGWLEISNVAFTGGTTALSAAGVVIQKTAFWGAA